MDGLSSQALGSIVFAMALLVAAPGLWAVLKFSGIHERIASRLKSPEASAEPVSPQRERPSAASLAADKLGAMVSGMVPTDGEQLSAIRFRLLRARYTHKHAVALYFASRFVCLILLQGAFFFALPHLEGFGLGGMFPFALSGMLAMLGLMLPGMWVDKRIKAAEQECSDGFPDMMDLLVACVEAGLSLDAAVLRVADELEHRHRELSLNLKTLALEMRAGRARKTAWRAFADRVGLEEAGSLATMLRQSEEMGTSLGETLRIFSKNMRQRRILIAEEKAMALPAQMTVPLILFVFPVLLGVLIIPAVIRFQSFM